MKNQNGNTVFAVFVVLLVIAGIYGWIANIVKIFGADFSAITGMLALRIVGIFIGPIGAILGFC